MYPEWVSKYQTHGMTIKIINGNYYLYSSTSKYVKGGKPKSIQKYIGRITEDGLIEPKKISFIPGIDKIVLLKDIKDDIDTSISKIPVIQIDNNYYCGKLTSKEIKIIKKYFNYEDGKIKV